MKKTVIIGCGRMGSALGFAMMQLKNQMNNAIIFVDPDIDNTNKNIAHFNLDGQVHSTLEYVKDDVDIVISAAPYHQNPKLAEYCFQKRWKWVDLGGHPRTDAKIRRMAKKMGGTCAVSQGLAPGLNCLILQNALNKNPNVKNLHIKVGGLPMEKDNILNYKTTWNYDGLFNEYTGECSVLRGGEVIQESALDTYWIIDNELECFNTKGGIDSNFLNYLKKKKIVNASYQTLRYLGHQMLISFMLKDMQMTQREFIKYIKRICPPTKKDVVHIILRVDQEIKKFKIESNETFTAMQMSTAFPAASVASWIAKNDIQGIIEYWDIDLKAIQENLNKIGYLPADILA